MISQLKRPLFNISYTIVSQLAKDLLHPTPEEEKRRHKKKRLVQSPNSYFMDVKCPGEQPFLFSFAGCGERLGSEYRSFIAAIEELSS